MPERSQQAGYLAGFVLLFAACGRTPVEPLTGRDEGDRDICGTRNEELSCASDPARFAASVLGYDRTVAGDIPPPGGAFSDPGAALGPPDFSFSRPNTAVSTGNGGVLELGFGECRLTNGGTEEPDIAIYEAGPFLETSIIHLHIADSIADSFVGSNTEIDGIGADGYVEVGIVTGSDGLDIDRVLSGFDACELRFDAIRIVDDATQGGWFSEGTGVDIDAVELLELVHPDVE